MPRKKPKPPESPGAVAPEVAPAGKREAHAGVGWLRLALVPSAGAAGAAAARSAQGQRFGAGAPRVCTCTRRTCRTRRSARVIHSA